MKIVKFLIVVLFLYSNLLLSGDSRYGDAFTPKGDLKVLLVCVGFGANDNQLQISGWPANQDFPNSINNKEVFYTSYNDFNVAINPAKDKLNISRWYYEMSNHTFRLIVNPIRVNISGSPINIATVGELGSLYSQIYSKLSVLNNNVNNSFRWSDYDNRKNSPKFLADYSNNNSPDNEVDFVVIVYRWAPPANGSPTVTGGASIGSGVYDNYVMNHGFTQYRGDKGIFGLFIHEVAHCLYNAPHYGNANDVCGKYFYGQVGGWGAMKLSENGQGNVPFMTANAWERWYLGWNEIRANGVNSNIKPPSGSGTYTLRDFATTGDAICIEIPSASNTKQRLWLENHQRKMLYDSSRIWDGVGVHNNSTGVDSFYQIPPVSKGIYAYIEDITGSRNETNPDVVFWNGANGIKYLHSQGNYDYTVDGIHGNYWGNVLYEFIEEAANPYSGQSRWEKIRFDADMNNFIEHDIDANSPTRKNEYFPILMRNGVITNDWGGVNANFAVGQKLGIATNPPLVNYPKFLSQGLEPRILNGIEVEVLSQNLSTGNITVRVQYNKVNIENDYRMTGKIHLPNIVTSGDNVDLRVMQSKTLTINKSGTPDRTTKLNNSFVNPSEFTCLAGSHFKMEAGSKVIVSEGSNFVLQSGSKLEINDGAVFHVKAGSKLDIQSGATVIINGSGRIVVECNGTIVSATPNNVNLVNYFSCVDLLTGSIGSITKTAGLGAVNKFSSCNFTSIVNVLNNYTHFCKQINSNAVVPSNYNTKFSAEDVIELKPGFELKLNTNFELIINKNNCQ